MVKMVKKAKWRMCQKRPEVGFDLHWHWGSWGELLNAWRFAKHLPDLYMQRDENGVVEDFEIDPVEMERRLFELSGW